VEHDDKISIMAAIIFTRVAMDEDFREGEEWIDEAVEQSCKIARKISNEAYRPERERLEQQLKAKRQN
jgi:hypothetical protein